MIRLILVLTVICLISAILLGAAFSLTKDKIAEQERKVEKEALSIVLPDAVDFVKENDYYKGFAENQKLIGYVLIGVGQGYSSKIKVMVGLDIEGSMKGIKILSQQETPGLGDRVDEIVVKGTIWDLLKGKKIVKEAPWFQTQFSNKSLDDIQGITGATITSNAVLNTVKNTINTFKSEVKVN